MSTHYSIAQRSPALNTLFAGAACAITLVLTAGPAMAETTTMERVNVRGRVIEAPVRYDVHAACTGLDDQIEEALGLVAVRTRLNSEVPVQFVMENGRVEGVQASSSHLVLRREVRAAVQRLSCGKQATAGAQIYRFNVVFVDPARTGKAVVARDDRGTGIRVAQLGN